jgi:glyoxylase-like metal-dependent hydrolase (beta-lactamase superfamily II)
VLTDSLVYPYAAPPEPGGALALGAGVHWLRLPVPGSLKHINVWLLEDGDAWALVDTGMNVREARAAWEGPLAAVLGGRPIRRIVCTHHHPDHAGLAVWLAERTGAEIWMGAVEHALMRRIAESWTDPQARAERVAAWTCTGLTLTDELRPILGAEGYRRVLSGVPESVRTLVGGGQFVTASGSYALLEVGGHTDGQILLYNAAAGLLIAGDQVLPRITSNISVFPERDDADPVATYLASFASLAAIAPEPLVLPSHGAVFRGLRARLAQLTAHHTATLATVAGLLHGPMTAAEVAAQLYPRKLDALNTMLAVGETDAHLRRLVNLGRANVAGGPGGVRRYQRSAA